MKKYFFLTLLIFLLNSCGFTVVDRSKLSNSSISEIQATGDKRINYNLKNKLLFNTDKNNENLIVLELETNKTKSVKEKNIKNEITKYQIDINVIIKYKMISDSDYKQFSVSKNGDYDRNDQYAQTLNNEKKTIETITDNLATEIFDQLIIKFNDL